MNQAVRLYAHRGAAFELPENTIPAFARAVEIGVDALEMDGHLSRDGHVVISHDPSGARMCGVDEMIKASDLADIKGWNAASTFRDEHGGPSSEQNLAMPTLDEVLDEFPAMLINLDIKQHDAAMVDATLDVIDRKRAHDRVILASFDAGTLVRVRRSGYPGVTALPRAELLAFLAMPRWAFRHLPWRGSAAQLPHKLGRIDVGRRYIINKCHSVGIRADFWTVNDPKRALQLLEAGADGIMTDDPATIAPVIERWRNA